MELQTAQERYRLTPKYRETRNLRKARPEFRAAQREADKRFKKAHPDRRKAQYSGGGNVIGR